MEKSLILHFSYQLSISMPLKVLGILVLLGILFILFMVISAAMVKVDIQDISPISDDKRMKGSTITLGFFSDTHGFGCLRSPKWITKMFLKHNCQAVLFGGDCVHKKPVRQSDKRMLTEVSAALKQSGIDLYAVYGNHDWRLSESDYKEMGAILLKDDFRVLTLNGSEFALCGVADSERGQRQWHMVPSDFTEYQGFRLLLVHNPDYVYALPDLTDHPEESPFDYMLAGHLHGGQVHLPGNLEFTFFREDRIAREAGILGGRFNFRGYQGLISKGAGNGFLPIRLMARPEIHILRFHI